jgi:hypothetical protein
MLVAMTSALLATYVQTFQVNRGVLGVFDSLLVYGLLWAAFLAVPLFVFWASWDLFTKENPPGDSFKALATGILGLFLFLALSRLAAIHDDVGLYLSTFSLVLVAIIVAFAVEALRPRVVPK